MRNTSIFHVLILIGAIVLIGSSGLVWAESPSIRIDLSFEKSFYQYGQPIGVKVKVANLSGENQLISKGFSSMDYYMQMRLTDPANQLLLARHNKFHDEFPDAPPVPFVSYKDRIIRAASCEVLPAGWNKISRTDDIRNFYEMKLPGYYSAQVQISAMVFKGDPCDIHDYEWLGVLKSETKYFYFEGSTEVNIRPEQWERKWLDGKEGPPNVEVEIWPEEGKTVEDYRFEGVKLNNVKAHKVFKFYDRKKEKYCLQALFNTQEAVKSLGDLEVNQVYRARISGRLTTGSYFGGSRQIRIIR